MKDNFPFPGAYPFDSAIPNKSLKYRFKKLLAKWGILTECCLSSWYYNEKWDRAYCRRCNKRIW